MYQTSEYPFHHFSHQQQSLSLTRTIMQDKQLIILLFSSWHYFSLGVYLCRHADMITRKPLAFGSSGILIVFKILKV